MLTAGRALLEELAGRRDPEEVERENRLLQRLRAPAGLPPGPPQPSLNRFLGRLADPGAPLSPVPIEEYISGQPMRERPEPLPGERGSQGIQEAARRIRSAAPALLSVLPGIGEAMDVYDIGSGAVKALRGDVAEGAKQAGFGAAGLALPMVGGRVLKKAGDLGAAGGGGRVVPQGDNAKRSVEEAAEAVRRWDEAGRPNPAHATGRVAREARDALRALEDAGDPDVFWRGTNRPEELDDIKRGVAVTSKNHASGTPEKGLSVSETPATVWAGGYPYAYRVRGEVVGRGSDGEPILKNVTPVDDRALPADEVLAGDQDRVLREKSRFREVADLSGVDPRVVDWLRFR